ncbi:hypothetical protein R1flu_013064 [Riccia fluitans]|uniref:26S proteasome complex subunit SEM1 n=1 Tax=Riccia fluitans TaxID=41844 RepID=A0ABD1ZCE8_9MARC
MQSIDRLVEAQRWKPRVRMSKRRKLFSDEASSLALKVDPDGYALDKQVPPVINQVQRMVGKANRSFCSTMLVPLVVAHVDPRMADYRPDWHMWVSSEIRSRLGREGKDKFSGGKFREDGAGHQAKQRTEAVRPEKEALQQQYAKDKAEWERKNMQLIEEDQIPSGIICQRCLRVGSKVQEICAKFLHYRQEMAGAPENAPKQASEDVKLDLFEDDDEFEEFETEEWDGEEGEKVTLQQWEEDWDDDDVNDDFSAQLRTELESASAAAETPAAS